MGNTAGNQRDSQRERFRPASKRRFPGEREAPESGEKPCLRLQIQGLGSLAAAAGSEEADGEQDAHQGGGFRDADVVHQ